MTPKTPKFFSPPNKLKQKVGSGGIPAYILKKCQEYLEGNPVDLTPYATRHLDELNDIKNKIVSKNIDDNTAKIAIVNISMQLKSNGSMFHYQLLSMVSDVMLHFIENVKETNSDFVEILTMHNRILEVILTKRLKGNGGKEGYSLTQELHEACLRYYAKYNIIV